MALISEDDLEQIALEILEEIGYKHIYGPDISPGGKSPEREFHQIILEKRLKQALKTLNPKESLETIEEAIRKIKRITNNQEFHRILTEGLDIEIRKNNEIRTTKIYLLGEKNELLAINQLTIIENKNNRRPDIILYINGLPLVIFELKNLVNKNTTINDAYEQIQTYKKQISSLFTYNELIILSDGSNARVGTLTSPREWFLEWKLNKHTTQIETIIKSMLEQKTLIDLIQNFITFEKKDKILAGYHQYRATNEAIKNTKQAIKSNKKIGVIWHTQGSGKSLTLTFYAAKIALEKELENPTLLIITDRNDLDDQLFQTFSSSSILREKPQQADSKQQLKQLLKRSSGGIIFTTIQKFNPDESEFETLSERKNIIVAADEAHRTQYGFKAKILNNEKKYGFAKYLRDALPNASFIGFTGTPIDFEERNTRAIFGDYIDTYDIHQAVEDKRTVSIYYEARLAKVNLKQEQLSQLDEEFDEITEREEESRKQTIKSSWARVEKIVGQKTRIQTVAKDIINHFEKRQSAINGKAMIVCMSRRICIDLYNEIEKLKPDWTNKDDKKGLMKVIMTGSASDGAEWQQHIRDKTRRRQLGDHFKKEDSEFKLAIVRDMWLTGFDVPSLHTLYLDKPMKGHTLMQAIARVNRVYKDKSGGLIVDYIGIAHELKKALKIYSSSGGKGKPTYDQADAIKLMKEKYQIIKDMFHNFDYKKFFSSSKIEKMNLIIEATDHILKQKEGKKRYFRHVAELAKAYALSVPSEEAEQIRDDLALFQAVKATIDKNSSSESKSDKEMDTALNQIVSKAVSSDEVIDIFKFSGMKRPEISVLDDAFLEEVQSIKYKNLAIEALKKLLNDQIKVRFKHNKIKDNKFSEMLEKAIRKYQNRSIDSAQVIKELVDIAKKLREEKSKGKELGLSEEEEAFYDALANNESAVETLGMLTLKKMAHELTDLVKNNTSIDWTLRESVQSKLKVMVKHLLRKYGYPPDKQQMATDLVLEQAKLFAEDWTKEDTKEYIAKSESF